MFVVHSGCQDPTMQKTQFCIERGEKLIKVFKPRKSGRVVFSTLLSMCCCVGSLWRPNISVSQTPAVRGRSALAVSFVPDTLCENYMVIVSCSAIQHVQSFQKVRLQFVGHSHALFFF